MVGACITLCLDLFQRSESDTEAEDNRSVLDRAQFLLRTREDSVLASQGANLIWSLLNGGRVRPIRARAELMDTEALNWPLEAREDIGAIWQKDSPSALADEVRADPNGVEGVEKRKSDGEQALPNSGAQDDILADLSCIDMMTENLPFESGLDTLRVIEELFR